ncbi:DUF3592 domain-containing protein [Streptomyces sp. NPDC007172]|uniref:DUF3592 domain-containing protein n=1 Tax=Streptomyces sp. NPDC007172 TaxID=3364776 RepID=UPI00369AFE20
MIGFVIIVSGMLLIPLGVFVLLDVIPQLRNRKLLRVGVRVDGTCEYVSWSSESQTLCISYTTQDGVEREHHTDPVHMPRTKAGDIFELYYDPARPARAVLATKVEDHAKGRILSGVLFYLELLFLLPQLIWVLYVSQIQW